MEHSCEFIGLWPRWQPPGFRPMPSLLTEIIFEGGSRPNRFTGKYSNIKCANFWKSFHPSCVLWIFMAQLNRWSTLMPQTATNSWKNSGELLSGRIGTLCMPFLRNFKIHPPKKTSENMFHPSSQCLIKYQYVRQITFGQTSPIIHYLSDPLSYRSATEFFFGHLCSLCIFVGDLENLCNRVKYRWQ